MEHACSNDSADNGTGRLTPGKLARELGERLHDDAIVAWDSGHNTGVLARYVNARGSQQFAGSGMLATMACSLPYAIAAALAFPGRQVVAFTGDGGLAMLLGELATIVRYRLPIKIVVMKNNSLGQIKWEQLMFLGNPEYECDLTPIDFARVGRGLRHRAASAPTLRRTAARRSTLRCRTTAPRWSKRCVDPYEPLLPPKRIEKYAKNLEKALKSGTRDAERIRAALEREPSRTQLSDRDTDSPEPLIGAEGTEQPGEPRRSGAPGQRPVDEEVDASLASSFPASDPASHTTTEGRRAGRN